jgi:TRAP-type C4-dicarboxylate transport system substrate-binding protein
MTLTRRFAMALASGAVAAPFVRRARAADVTLKLHHFLGPTAPAQADFFEPWAKTLEEQSDGRLKVEIYPSMSLGGRPPQLYNQVRDGIVDIVWTLPGYTAGQFPRSEVFEIPFVHKSDPRATNLALQDLYEEWLAPDFADVHPILLHVHAGQAFHMVDSPIQSIDDCKGKKIRIPTRMGGWMIEAFGANPVGMPVPGLPQALSTKVIDGALIPFEVALPLKVHELTKFHTVGPDDERFGTSVFLFAMNKGRYEGLPEDLRAVLDANSGANIAAEVGTVWSKVEEPGREAAMARGNEIIELSEDEMARFRKASEPVADRWVKEVSSLGIDGAALLEAARAAVAKNS